MRRELATDFGMVGVVVGNKMDKTIVVQVSRRFQHARYKKYITRSKKYKAHDEANEYNCGDTVELVETHPLSKEKRWRVSRLIERGSEM